MLKIATRLSIAWLFLSLLISISLFLDVKGMKENDLYFIDRFMKPQVELVKNTLETNGKNLQNGDIKETIINRRGEKIEVLKARVLFGNQIPLTVIEKYGDPPVDGYVVPVWNGDFDEYYISWVDKYDKDVWGLKDSIYSGFMMIFFGIIPLIFILVLKKFVYKN